MNLNDENTWPRDIIDFLEAERELFTAWETRSGSYTEEAYSLAATYDRTTYALRDVLNRYALRGHHCTRLTETEIAEILNKGMHLPNLDRLAERIAVLRQDGLISHEVAAHLTRENDAASDSRANKIWFCFFPPRHAGQWGIERLFRSWGGEALYCCHERDAESGPVLNSIGIPCLVEADVPIASLAKHGGVEGKFVRQFLINRGMDIRQPVEHEDRAVHPLSADSIRRVIRFPDPDFIALTECNMWRPPLA